MAASWLGAGDGGGDDAVNQELRKRFPDSFPTRFTVNCVTKILGELGMTAANTRCAQCICPEELPLVKATEDGLTFCMQARWGKCFLQMGGLGGLPFLGQAGLDSFLSSAPGEGHVILVFGPHLGISSSGKLGETLLPGKNSPCPCCSMALDMYTQLKRRSLDKGIEGPGDLEPEDLDPQLSWALAQLHRNWTRIEVAEDPMLGMASTLYGLIESQLRRWISKKRDRGNIVLFGGIQLNLPTPGHGDNMDVLTLELMRPDGKVVDLLPQLRTAQATVLRSASDAFRELSWSPPASSKCYEALHRTFRGALPGQAAARRSYDTLLQMGITKANTLYGCSTCADFENLLPGGMMRTMEELWGEPFQLSGLGGIPFVGTSGFTSFLSQGEEGDRECVLFFFGPHIGMDETGGLGRAKKNSGNFCSACRPVLTAYEECSSGKAGYIDEYDMQMAWLRAKIGRQLERIEAAPEPLAALMDEVFFATAAKVKAMMEHTSTRPSMVLLGGILINLPEPFVDHFKPLLFEVTPEGESTRDLLGELSSPKPTSK